MFKNETFFRQLGNFVIFSGFILLYAKALTTGDYALPTGTPTIIDFLLTSGIALRSSINLAAWLSYSNKPSQFKIF
jgi:hypothetical protein